MSQTIAHRHESHLHISWAPVLAVLATAIIAAAVLVVINQPTTTSTTADTSVGAAAVALTADVPKDLSPAFRLRLIDAARATAPAVPAALSLSRIVHNVPQGTLEARAVGGLAP